MNKSKRRRLVLGCMGAVLLLSAFGEGGGAVDSATIVDALHEAMVRARARTGTPAKAAARPQEAPQASRVSDAPMDSEEPSANALRTMVAYATPSESEMAQLFEYVRHAPHVKENPLYAQAIRNAEFVYKVGDSANNAYSDGSPRVCFFGGSARFARLIGLAAAAEQSGRPGSLAKLVSSLTPEDCFRMDDEAFVRVALKTGIVCPSFGAKERTLASSVAAGVMMGVLAHEVGHIALGHVFSPGYGGKSLERSRNEEREADSFASSCLADSPFGEYILAGQLVYHYALAQQEDGHRESTHPLSRERFENFVRANPDLAASLGIQLP